MIKSTKVSTKFTNPGKLKSLHNFIDEYRLVVAQFVDILWNKDNPPKLLPKSTTSQVKTWLSARAVQAAGKQASGIVRGTIKKQNQRIYVYEKLIAEGKTKQASKLKSIINKNKITKPNINQVEPELDLRFIKQDWHNTTSFDGIITLSSLGDKLKIVLPIKKTKHFNKLLLQNGSIKPGLRISKKNLTFMLDLPNPAPRGQGQTIGLDVGVLNTFTLSNGISSKKDIHNHTLQTINQKLARKQKGSKAFLKAQRHRTNYINWSLNQINFTDIKTLRIEKINYLRKYKKTSRYLSHFTYTELFNKLQDLTKSNGVRLEKVNPTYTSQRCSSCGWVRKSNRKGKLFKCEACKFECDSDYNASRNISFNLPSIKKAERLKHKNRKGFYWNALRGSV